MKKIILILLGLIAFLLGVVGTILPILPTTPFLILSFTCFTMSSNHLTSWFMKTKLYQTYLADYQKQKGLKKEAKIKIMATITLFMSFGFILMGLQGIYLGCLVLLIVWIVHCYYFFFHIKTIRP